MCMRYGPEDFLMTVRMMANKRRRSKRMVLRIFRVYVWHVVMWPVTVDRMLSPRKGEQWPQCTAPWTHI